MKKPLVIRPHPVDKEQRDKDHAVLAWNFLWELMRAAKTRLPTETFVKQGGLDAEELLECLETGNTHPMLDDWRRLRSVNANHPPPTTRERLARRLVVLAVVALKRAVSLTDQKAREDVAARIAESFDDPPTAEAIRKWPEHKDPPTEAEDRYTITAALRRTRADCDDDGNAERVIGFFASLIRVVLTPEGAVSVTDEPPAPEIDAGENPPS